MKKNTLLSSLVLLILGTGLYTLITWKWNVAAAAWLAPILLMRYFRLQRRWLATIPAALLLWAASYANKAGAWGMDPLLEVAVCAIAALPMIAALYLDRYTSRRLAGLWGTLVFPAAFVGLDYAASFLPLGTIFSPAVSQFYHTGLIQIATVTGIWGIAFLMMWMAPVINHWWEQNFDFRAARAPITVYAAVLVVTLLAGGVRLVMARPASQTVRVAGVTVAHPRNYWDVLIDQGTPKGLAQSYAAEFQGIADQLFAESETAARSGAQVIFWSEANAFLLPEQKAAFLQRAQDFARQNGVYLMPAYQVLRYGDTSGFNGLSMITPQGEVAYEYEKTKSWYATTSDGIVHTVATPFGRIGAVICFDLDFPGLVRQAAQQGADILLVPAYDTYATRTYHTEVGLLRGVEDGFGVVRMVNEGTSIAVDARGQVLAWQDFFTAPQRVMALDVPTQGMATIYGRFGDWFAWFCVAALVVLVIAAVRSPVRSMEAVEQTASVSKASFSMKDR